METEKRTITVRALRVLRNDWRTASRLTLLLLVGSVLFEITPVAAQAVRVPGTSVSLIPPPGFSAAQQFPGFQNLDLQSSIVVTEMPAPVTVMTASANAEAFANKGMVFMGSKKVIVGGKEALLVRAVQGIGESEVLKWMLIGGDKKHTVMIVTTFPRSAVDAVNQPLVRSLLTASWNSESTGDPFEGLLYRVTSGPVLRIATRITHALLLTESGSMPRTRADEALYIVGNSVGQADLTDLKSFSESRARQAEKFKDVQVLSGRPIQLDGLDAYEILADVTDEAGTRMNLYQVVARYSEGYFLIQGLITAARATEMLPEFKRVTATFRQVRAQ